MPTAKVVIKGLIKVVVELSIKGTFSCTANYFSCASASNAPVGSGIMTEGIYIGNPLTSLPSFFTTSPNNGLKIMYNNFDKVICGIQEVNLQNPGYTKTVGNNAIVLVASTNTNTQQWGFKGSSNNLSMVISNTVIGFPGTSSLNVAGILHEDNTPGGASAQCNSVSFLPRGFEFKNLNTNFYWRFNNMSNCIRGMQASNWGTGTSTLQGIGPQGSATQMSGNQWLGSWTTPSLQTYMANGSNAANSILYVASTGAGSLTQSSQGYTSAVPPTNSYWNALNRPTTNSGTTTCGTSNPGGGCANCTNLIGNEPPADESEEINELLLFISLNMDSMLLTYSDTVQDWYNNRYDSYGPLVDIENKLATGDFESAQTLISSFEPESNIQANYKNFFQLYHNFAKADSLLVSDSLNLYILSVQCPGKDGPSIYKARSLYNLIYKTVLQFNDDSCETIGYSGRPGRNVQEEQKDKTLLEANEKNQIKKKQRNDLKIYPNPSQNAIYITGKKLCQNCQILITDINGRILQKEKLTSSNGKLIISFNLVNGIYFINLIDETGYSTVKKFIVAR